MGVDEARRHAYALLDDALAILHEAGLQDSLLQPLAELGVRRTC